MLPQVIKDCMTRKVVRNLPTISKSVLNTVFEILGKGLLFTFLRKNDKTLNQYL